MRCFNCGRSQRTSSRGRGESETLGTHQSRPAPHLPQSPAPPSSPVPVRPSPLPTPLDPLHLRQILVDSGEPQPRRPPPSTPGMAAAGQGNGRARQGGGGWAGQVAAAGQGRRRRPGGRAAAVQGRRSCTVGDKEATKGDKGGASSHARPGDSASADFFSAGNPILFLSMHLPSLLSLSVFLYVHKSNHA